MEQATFFRIIVLIVYLIFMYWVIAIYRGNIKRFKDEIERLELSILEKKHENEKLVIERDTLEDLRKRYLKGLEFYSRENKRLSDEKDSLAYEIDKLRNSLYTIDDLKNANPLFKKALKI